MIDRKMRLYFAYGSNLNRENMAQRCPDALPVMSFTLPNWRLVFRTHADIVLEEYGREGAGVPGAIYEITERCERALDIYEGVAGGYYRKAYIGTPICPALVYIMTDRLGVDLATPTREYYERCVQGCKDWDLEHDHLKDALMDTVDAGKVGA